MTRIDPIRLTEIFRTLSAKTKGTQQRLTAKSPSVQSENNLSNRDKTKLKKNIRERLYKIKNNENFSLENEASLIAIQEIIAWEFGENILNHPDYNRITATITENIAQSPILKQEMNNTISSILEDDNQGN